MMAVRLVISRVSNSVERHSNSKKNNDAGVF